MYFSWVDFEVNKLYREACLKEAHDRRLIRPRDVNPDHRILFVAPKMTRIREWLMKKGRNLKGLEHPETSAIGPRGASYE